MHESYLTKRKKEDILVNFWEFVQRTVHDFGDKEFIVTKNGSVTYAEANHYANVIFHAIREKIAKKGTGIGLFIKDHRKIIPAMMGVLKSGNYFIPLEVSFPADTLHYIIKNSEIMTLLAVDQHADRIRSLVGDELPIINTDELDFRLEIEDPTIHYRPEDIVQILYTSGSTGQPKGAIEDYRCLVRTAYNNTTYFWNNPDERTLHLSTFTYSATHNTVFAALLNGMTLCYYNVKEDGFTGLPKWIRTQRITTFHSTPTVFRSLISILDANDRFPFVRNFAIGGEKLLHKDIEAMKKHFPGAKWIRLGFASTETQGVATKTVPMDYDFDQENLPSGNPREDIKVFIWDEHGNPQPVGKEGEIVVYGDSMVRGYINNPELTRERFIPDPDHPGWQYFKTGDLGKLLPDGQLMHMGRIDNMVKIKGVRIELNSIERHILSFPGITQVASRAFEDQRGNKKLVSYFVAEKGIEIPISDLRKHLAERLPAHAMPHYLISMDKLPLTETGKIAISQLPLPQMIRPKLSNPYVPPANEVEKKLVEIWEEQVGIEGIGATDNFFEVGGDSLLGVLLFVKIEKVFGRNLPVSVLLKASTVRMQANIIRNKDTSQDFSPVIPINTVGQHPPLFFIPGKGGFPTRIHNLAKKIDSQTPVYALQDLFERPENRNIHSIISAASFYLNEIKKLYPASPYILIGESMGGKIAFEIAQQLVKSGEKEPVLIMLDTYNYEESIFDLYLRKHRLNFYSMLIKKHLSILARSDWQGKLDYLRFYRETFGQKVKRFLRRRFNKSKNVENFTLPSDVRQVELANLEAERRYKVEPYPGRVILFKATRGPKADNPTDGWDRIKLGELIIHPLDCYHGSILFDPAVSELAEILQAYIGENIGENA